MKPAIIMRDVVKTFNIKHSRTMKQTFVDLFKRGRSRSTSTEFRALDGITFDVAEGESVAVLGRNGSGKSTTLKLISGVQQPDEGWVRTRGRIGGLLEVGAGFHPDLTGRDNLYLNAAILGMSKAETDAKYDDIVEFAGISEDFLDSEVKRYSSGMKSRLGFAVAVHTDVDVLLVDEVLSVGDAAFKAKCNDKIDDLLEQGKTMFVVSHSIGTVKRLCDRGIVLEEGRVIFDGPIEEAAELVAPPKAKKRAVVNTTGFEVAPELQSIFEDPHRGLGQPAENPVAISENGGGVMQRFERGIATYSRELDFATGIRLGKLERGYLESGGPTGPWGFLASRVQGSLANNGKQHLSMQHGTASWAESGPVEYEPGTHEEAQEAEARDPRETEAP